MEIFELLKEDLQKNIKVLAIYTVIAGISNAALLSIINAGAANVANETISNHFFILFILGLAVYVLSRRYVAIRSVVLVESVLNRIRYRIADKIRHTELSTLEAIGTSPLYARLTEDTGKISSSAGLMINATQSIVMLFFATLYIICQSRVKVHI